jgi:hypothetical protein
LYVPSESRTVKYFADDERIIETQSRFIEQYSGLIKAEGFPYISCITLLYPVAAMLSLTATPMSVVEILGHGFANLGYLLLAAGVFVGRFRVFALEGRMVTMVAAAGFLIIGIVLTNVA